VMIHDQLPKPYEVAAKILGETRKDKLVYSMLQLGRKGNKEQIPAILITPKDHDGTTVVWIHPEGKASLLRDGQLIPEVQGLVKQKAAILAPDLFMTGEFKLASLAPVDARYAGYTFGYNRPLLANRVHDILTCVAYAREAKNANRVDLVGFEKAGPWVLLARALCADAVHRTVVDINRFRFEDIQDINDEMLLPGALKYGGLPAFAALCAPGELFLHNHRGMGIGGYVRDAYQAAGRASGFHHQGDQATTDKILEWLLR